MELYWIDYVLDSIISDGFGSIFIVYWVKVIGTGPFVERDRLQPCQEGTLRCSNQRLLVYCIDLRTLAGCKTVQLRVTFIP